MNNDSGCFIILIPAFPKDEQDENWLPFPQLFVKTLKQLNPDLEIIVLAFQYPYSTVDYLWNGVTIKPFNGQHRGKISRLLLWFKVNRCLKSISQEKNIKGILNFWLGECAYVGHRFARKQNLLCYTWLMGQDAKASNRYVMRIKPVASELIALSDHLSMTFKNNYNIKPAHIIPPGISTKEFMANSSARSIDILGVGSLIPLKQFEIFIRIIDRIKQIRPNIKSAICGGGAEKQALQELILQHNLVENVTLMGEQPHSKVIAMMQQSKILLHPSSYEGFATVYSEALYAGAHVIGFSQPMTDIFPHQHVVSDENQMLQKVIDLLNDDTLEHNPVISYKIEESCRKIFSLYR